MPSSSYHCIVAIMNMVKFQLVVFWIWSERYDILLWDAPDIAEARQTVTEPPCSQATGSPSITPSL
jgi:hypothetical protein